MWKSVKNSETILPFSCCTLVFLIYNSKPHNSTNGLHKIPALRALLLDAGSCCKLQETWGNARGPGSLGGPGSWYSHASWPRTGRRIPHEPGPLCLSWKLLETMCTAEPLPLSGFWTSQNATFQRAVPSRRHFSLKTLSTQGNYNWRGKNLGHSDLDRFTRTKVQNWTSLFF